MKKILLVMSVLTTLLLGACSNDEPQSSYTENEVANEKNSLSEVLSNLVIKDTYDEDDYVLYDASEDEYISISGSEYAIVSTLEEVVAQDDTNATRAAGPWIKGGTGKGSTDAVKLGYKISKKIPAKKNFEIKVIYNKDGSYTVYYRVID